MSGGSYDYACHKVREMAESLSNLENPRRKAFQSLLFLVADAMHDIEWVDSCDYVKGDEDAAIDRCLSFMGDDPGIIIKAAAFDQLAKTFKALEKK